MISRVVRRLLQWIGLFATAPIWLPRLVLVALRRYDVVRIPIATPIPELGRAVGLERFVRKPRLGLWELYELVRAASRDRKVRAVHLEVEGGLSDSVATIQSALELVGELRAAGKKVLVTASQLDNGLAWLAARADGFAIPPAAIAYLPGHSAEIPFVGGLLESLGLRAEVVKSGDFKTAGDTLTRRDISPAHRSMVESLLSDLQSQFVGNLAEGRRLAPEKVAELVDRAFLTAEEARDAGLVDRILYPDQVVDWLTEVLGSKPRVVGAWRYLAGRRLVERLRRAFGRPRKRLAVLSLEGVILHEAAGRTSHRDWISAESVRDPLETIRKDRSVRGAMLRINSPGGSGSESELIWREVKRLAEAKPVVASMGDVAASGGYYLAAPATRIVAQAGTLTGSIGVLAAKLDASAGLERIGVHVVQIGKSRGATLFSPASPFTPEQRELMEAEIRRFYDLFLTRVAEGRGLEPSAVHEVAQGRVWTGRQALERRLADANGGLLESLRLLKREAGIPEDEPVDVLIVRPAQPIGLLRFLGRRSILSDPLARGIALLGTGGPLAWWSEQATIR